MLDHTGFQSCCSPMIWGKIRKKKILVQTFNLKTCTFNNRREGYKPTNSRSQLHGTDAKCLENKTQSSKPNIIKTVSPCTYVYMEMRTCLCNILFTWALSLSYVNNWESKDSRVGLQKLDFPCSFSLPSVRYFVLTLHYSDNSEEHQLKHSNNSCLLHLVQRNTDISTCPKEKKKAQFRCKWHYYWSSQ